ncbi:hypothetical protein [Leifsonia sp. LS-T14]|uniref:MmyB family transcriptional regulator n=1 Tax=unclassified Leifsonia TaxID=2663824 RepID=UPI0035A629AA
MSPLSMPSRAGGRSTADLEELVKRLDAARTPEENRAAVKALLDADPAHGYPVTPRGRRWRGSSATGAEVVPRMVSEALRRMETPAYVQGRLMDVLEANALAGAVTPYFRTGSNLILSVFLGVAVADRASDWEDVTRAMVQHLLDRAEREPADDALHALVGELAVRSPRFRALWATEKPSPQVSSVGEWNHPVAGQLRLTREKTAIEGTDGMMLVTYRAEPGSVTEVALELLRALPAPLE